MQRKTISKIFFKDNFDGFLRQVFNRHAVTMCNVLRQHAESGKGIDAQNLMYRYTLDSIAEIGFGIPFGALEKPLPIAKNFDRSQVRVPIVSQSFSLRNGYLVVNVVWDLRRGALTITCCCRCSVIL